MSNAKCNKLCCSKKIPTLVGQEWDNNCNQSELSGCKTPAACQDRLEKASPHYFSSLTNAHRVFKFVSHVCLTLLVCTCFGLVSSAVDAVAESRATISQNNDLLTSHRVSPSISHSSPQYQLPSIFNPEAQSTLERRQVHRQSIWRNPLSTFKLRNRLISIRRPFSVTGTARDSKSPSTYLRLSQFVRNRLQNVGHSVNNRLHHMARSLEDKQRQLLAQVANDTVDNARNNTTLLTELGADQTPITTESVIDRLNRRNDETSWLNHIDSDPSLNLSLKTVDPIAPISPTLNVIDLESDKTKIAHNILVVRSKGGNQAKTSAMEQTNGAPFGIILAAKLQTPAPVVVSSEIKNVNANQNIEPKTANTSNGTSAEDPFLEFVSIKNNHRTSGFMSLAKWKLKNKDKVVLAPSSNTNKTESNGTTAVSTSPPPTTLAHQSTNSSTPSSSAEMSPSTRTSTPTLTYFTGQWPVSVSMRHTLPTIAPQWSASTFKMTSTSRTHVSEFVASDLTTREQWSTASSLIQDDFWSSFATENPMTTVFTTSSVTEFDLPITDANESTQSWEKPHNGSSGSVWKETAWSELITNKPFDASSTDDRNTTAKVWTAPTSGKQDDDDLIELHRQTWQTNIPSTTTASPSEDRGENKANFYANSGQQHHHHQSHPHKGPSDDGVVIFKNNHGRPRRPISALRPTTTKHFITAKPPYVTDFLYPTTISVRKPAITITNVTGHKVKQPDEVQSATLTVRDPPYSPNSFMQLPLNTTIVHKNLLVPMKEGRPKPSYPVRPTTQFPPVYPIVAGVSNWQTPTTPWILPAMTTSAPDKLDGLIVSANTGNFSFAEHEHHDHDHEDEFKLFTTTPAPSKIVNKVISVFPGASHSASIDRVSIHKGTNATHSSTTIRPASYPVSTSAGYVNAIYAPPMPVFRPAHSIDSSTLPVASSWLNPLRRWLAALVPNYDQMSVFSIVRSALYSLMVMILPPLALVSAFALV